MDLILKIKKDIDEQFIECIDRKTKLRNAKPLTNSQKHHYNAIISRLVLRKYFCKEFADSLVNNFVENNLDTILPFILSVMGERHSTETNTMSAKNDIPDNGVKFSDVVADSGCLAQQVFSPKANRSVSDKLKHVLSSSVKGKGVTPLKNLLKSVLTPHKNVVKAATIPLDIATMFEQAHSINSYEPLIGYRGTFDVFDMLPNKTENQFYKMHNSESDDISKSKILWESECRTFPDTMSILSKAFNTYFYLEKETYELVRMCLFRLLNRAALRTLMDTMLVRVVSAILSMSYILDDESDTRRYFLQRNIAKIMFGLLSQLYVRYEVSITCDPEEDYDAFDKEACKNEIGKMLENGVTGFPVNSQTGLVNFWEEIIDFLWEIRTPFLLNKPGAFENECNTADLFYSEAAKELGKKESPTEIIRIQKGKTGSLKFWRAVIDNKCLHKTVQFDIDNHFIYHDYNQFENMCSAVFTGNNYFVQIFALGNVRPPLSYKRSPMKISPGGAVYPVFGLHDNEAPACVLAGATGGLDPYGETITISNGETLGVEPPQISNERREQVRSPTLSSSVDETRFPIENNLNEAIGITEGQDQKTKHFFESSGIPNPKNNFETFFQKSMAKIRSTASRYKTPPLKNNFPIPDITSLKATSPQNYGGARHATFLDHDTQTGAQTQSTGLPRPGMENMGGNLDRQYDPTFNVNSNTNPFAKGYAPSRTAFHNPNHAEDVDLDQDYQMDPRLQDMFQNQFNFWENRAAADELEKERLREEKQRLLDSCVEDRTKINTISTEDGMNRSKERPTTFANALKCLDSVSVYTGLNIQQNPPESFLHKCDRLLPKNISEDVKFRAISSRLSEMAEDLLDTLLMKDPHIFDYQNADGTWQVSFEKFREWFVNTFSGNSSLNLTKVLEQAASLKQKNSESICDYVYRATKIFKGQGEKFPADQILQFAINGLLPKYKSIAKMLGNQISNLIDLKLQLEIHEGDTSVGINSVEMDNIVPVLTTLLDSQNSRLAKCEQDNERVLKSTAELSNGLKNIESNHEMVYSMMTELPSNQVSPPQNSQQENPNQLMPRAPASKGFKDSQHPYGKIFNQNRFQKFDDPVLADNNAQFFREPTRNYDTTRSGFQFNDQVFGNSRQNRERQLPFRENRFGNRNAGNGSFQNNNFRPAYTQNRNFISQALNETDRLEVNYNPYQSTAPRNNRPYQFRNQNGFRNGMGIQRDVRLDQNFRQQNRPNMDNQNFDAPTRMGRNPSYDSNYRSQSQNPRQFNANRFTFQNQNQPRRPNQNFSNGNITNGRYERVNNRDFLDRGQLNQRIQQ